VISKSIAAGVCVILVLLFLLFRTRRIPLAKSERGMCYFIDESRCISIGSCISAEGEPKGENIAGERETEGEGEEVSVRIKRNSRSSEKSNGFHSVPSSRTRSSLFSYPRSSLTTGRSSPLHFRRTSRKTFSHKASFLLPAARRRESLQRTSNGKGGQADDEEPAIIHLYTRDHPDRWPGSRVDSSNIS